MKSGIMLLRCVFILCAYFNRSRRNKKADGKNGGTVNTDSRNKTRHRRKHQYRKQYR